MTLTYDDDADVLYITFEEALVGSYSYAENGTGAILRLDAKRGVVIGLTIPFFKRRAIKDESENKCEIPEIGGVPFNAMTAELVSSA